MTRPETESDLAETIRNAKNPLCICGGATRGMSVPGGIIETGGLSGISLYEPDALTMVAGAGTPLAEIEGALAAEGQMLAFEPIDLKAITDQGTASTIGGVFATNASGPRRVQVGAARDFLLGVRFVDGAGNIVKNGGRVMKNVTGYDLVKLLAGSYGTLGVLSEVSFKVLPKPETCASLMIYGPGGTDAVGLMSRALGSPFEVSGAAHENAGAPVSFLRIEGFEASVRYRMKRLRELLEPMLSPRADTGIQVMTDADKVSQQWQALRDMSDDAATPSDVWRIAVKPSASPEIVARLPGDATYRLDWGGGRIWAFCEPGTDLRAALGRFEGHATLVFSRSGTDLPRFHPEPEPVARLASGLRAKFDPDGILNRGVMG